MGRVEPNALEARVAALSAEGRWREVVDAYRQSAVRAPSPEWGRRWFAAAAHHSLEALGDPAAAETYLRRVLASDPGHLPALQGLVGLALYARRPHRAAMLLEAAWEAAPPQDRAPLAVRLSEVALDELDERERALAACFLAYEADPKAGSLTRARRILLEDARPVEAADVLDLELSHRLKVSSQGGLGTALAELNLADLDPRVRALAEAYRTLGLVLSDHAVFHARAQELLERARSLGDEGALAALDDLEARAHDWEARAEDAQRRGREARDKREAAAAYLEAAQFYLVYGQEALRAEECFDRARLLHPGHRATLRVLEAVEGTAGRHADLLKRLNTAVATVKDHMVRTRLLASAARTAEAMAEAAEAAGDAAGEEAATEALTDALRRAHEISPDDRELTVRLSALLADLGRPEARAEVLERFVHSTSDPDLMVETRLELGRMSAEELGDASRARVHFEAALALRPDDFDAASALRALYRDSHERPLLLEALKVLSLHAPDYESSRGLARERLEVAREVSREERLAASRALFELEPTLEAEAELTEMARSSGRLEALAEALLKAAGGADGERRRQLLRSAARLLDSDLPKPREASRAWRELLALDPEDDEAREALERHLRDEDDPSALAEGLSARIADAPSADERRRLRLRLAEVFERRLDRLEDAMGVLESTLEDHPEDEAALAALAELYDRTQRLELLEGVLARLERLHGADASTLSLVQTRRARVLEQLEREDEAAELWLSVFPTAPDLALVPLEGLLVRGVAEVEIARVLEPVYASRGLSGPRRDVLIILAATTEDPEERRSARREAARLSVELGDIEAGLDTWIQTFAEDPEDEDALARIGSLLSRSERPEEVAERLEGIATRLEGMPRAQVLTTLARLWSELNPARARDLFEGALSADPGHPAALAGLEPLLAPEAPAALAAVLETQLAAVEDPSARAQMGLTLGALREERLGDSAGAIQAWRDVLAADPHEAHALARLATRLEPAADSAELLTVLDRLRSATTEPVAAAHLDLRAADVLRLHLGEPDEAFHRYLRAVEAVGGHEEAVRGLEALMAEPRLAARAGAALEPLLDGATQPAVKARAIEAQAEHDTTPESRQERALAVSELRTHAGEADGAFEGLLDAFSAGNLSAPHWPVLVTRAQAAGRLTELANVAEALAAARSDDTELWRFFARHAPTDLASRGWEAVLSQVPGDPEALESLERLTAAGDDPAALARVLETRAEATESATERASHYRRAAEIWEHAAESPERALAVLQRAQSAEEGDPRAWEAAARIFLDLERHEEHADALREAALRTEVPLARARLLLTEAQARSALGDAAGAVTTLEIAAAAAPDARDLRTSLEGHLRGPAAVQAALALEPIYRRAGDWASLADVYRVLAEASTDPQERTERWVAIRSIEEERLGRNDEARVAAERAFLEQPTQPDLLEALERTALAAGAGAELPARLLEASARCSALEDQRRILSTAARLADTHAPERSAELWSRLAEVQEDAETLGELAERLEGAGDPRAAAEALEHRARRLEEDPKDRGRALLEAGLAFEALDRDRARGLFAEALRDLDDPSGAVAGIQRTGSEHPQEVAKALEQALPRLEGAARSEALIHLGRLRHAALEAPEDAFEALSVALVDDDEGADGAAAELESLLASVREGRPALVLRVADALEPFLAKREAYARLIAVKEARAEAVEASQRTAIRREIADIYAEPLGRPEMAFVALARAFAEAPEDDELVSSLEALSERAGTREEWADLNVEALENTRSASPELARRAARLSDEVGPPERATTLWEGVLRQVPQDREALDALERLHRRAGRVRELAQIHRVIAATARPDEARARYTEIADLAENELEDVELAEEALGALRRLDPENVDVLRRLSSLGARADRPGITAEALEAELGRTEAADDRVGLLLQLGTLRRDRTGDLEGAVAAFAEVLELRTDDRGAVAGLASLLRDRELAVPTAARAAEALAPTYLRAAAFEDYLGCLERRVEATEGRARVELLTEIAEVEEDRLGRPDVAFAAARRAFHADEAQDPDVEARVERLARAHGLFEELAAVYLDEADATDVPGRALELRRRVARLQSEELSDAPRAIAEFERILEEAPGDPEALETLDELYARTEQADRRAEIFRRRIAQAATPDQRAQLMRGFAELQAGSLDDRPGAIATLRRLTQLAEDDLPALRRLADLLEQEGRDTELADTLERLVRLEDGAASVAARVRLGRIRARSLGDLGAADRLLAEALDTDPENAEAREFLQERFEDAVAEDDRATALVSGELLARAFRASEAWPELVSVLQLRAGLEPRVVERARLELEIARVQEEKLGEPGLALATLTGAVREAPGIADLGAALERLGLRLERPDVVVESYAAALPHAADPEVRERLERRIAVLVEPIDPERAFSAWQSVLAARPSDAEALEALDRLGYTLGRWAALTDVLERRAEAASEPIARSAILTRLGLIWDERLDEPEEALVALRRARSENPSAQEPLEALARLLDPERESQELGEVLEALTATAPDAGTAARAEIRLAELAAGPLNDPERALALWSRRAAVDPGDGRAPAALEELYERTGRWTELAQHLEGSLERARDDRELLRVQRKLGFVRGARLGSTEEAIRSWQEILRKNPNDVEALEALRDTYRRAEHWEELVGVLRKLVPLQPDAAGVKALRFELAEVLLDPLGRIDEGVEAARRALDLDPHTASELMRLEEIFEGAGADVEAVRVKTSRAESAETDGEKVEIWFEVAELYEHRIQRRAGALSAYERILDLEPENRRAYEALVGLLTDVGDYRRIVELHDRRLEVVEDAESRRSLLFAIVEVQEKWLGHPDLAFSAACRAFAEDGADARAQALAERLAEETDNWDLLAEVYEAQIEQVGAERTLELRRRLGEIALDHLSDQEEAERHLAWVLEQRPTDASTRDRLRGVFARSGRAKDEVELLATSAEASADVEVKRHLFFEMARIQERALEDPDAAIASVKRALDLDPEDREALEGASRLFREHRRFRPLVDILERRAVRAAPESEVALRFEIAEVVEKGIEDVPGAVEAYREVLRRQPNHEPTLEALERIHTERESWRDLVEILERRVAAEIDLRRRVDLLTRIASLREERFSDPQGAAASLLQALEEAPDDVATLGRLERVWRAEGEGEKLLETLERHRELVEAPEEVASLLLEMAPLREARGDREGAESALREFMEVAPNGREGPAGLGRLYASAERWPDALAMIEREIELVSEASEAAELHYRAGRLLADRMGEPDAARAAYERGVEADPGHGPSLRALRLVREAEGDFEDAIELEAREAESTEDLLERAGLYHHAAEAALERFDNVERAIEYLESGVASHPDHAPSLELLSELYFSEERWTDAEALLLRLVTRLDASEDRSELGRLHYRLAYIAEKNGDGPLALERYHASYERDSTYLPTLEGLAGALLRAERWEDAQRVYQAILIQHRSALTDAEVVDLHFQVGELAMRLEQLERARKSFNRVLDLDRSHVPTLGAFADLAEQEGHWEEAYELRERMLALLIDDGDRFAALLKQAELAERRIEEPWRAIDAYVEARRLRPDDVFVLRALVTLYRDTSQIPRALEVLGDLGLVLTEREDRRDVFLQMARLHHEQQGNATAAVQALNAALDVDPGHVEAFSRIEQILYEARAWSSLEENYHRMLKRLPKSMRKARVVLWHSLAELYTRVLQNHEGARIAYEVLHRLEPENHAVTSALAERYGNVPDLRAKAAELYLGLLPVVDDPAEPARSLFNLFFEMGALDRAFCALGALVLMGVADPTELKAHDGLLRFAPQGLSRALTDSLWRERLLHEHCRNELATVAAIVYRGAPSLFEGRRRAAGLKPRRERVDLGDTRKNAPARLRFFDVWSRLQKVMHVPEAELYLRPQGLEAPVLLPGSTPALLAGRQHGIFATASLRRVAFTLSRQMALARPELALMGALDPEDVAACLEGALRLVVPGGSGIDLGAPKSEIERWEKLLGRTMRDASRAALAEPARAVVDRRLMKVLARYLRGVEHTVNRAAVLVSGDVQTAALGLDETEPVVPDVSHRARVRELMLFVLGLDHFELREKLGARLERQADEAIRQRP